MAGQTKLITTKFGDLYADKIADYRTYDDFSDDSCAGHFNLYDSNNGHLTYWDEQTILENAIGSGCTPAEWWNEILADIARQEEIEWIIEDFITSSYSLFNKNDEDCKKRIIADITSSDAYTEEDIKEFDNMTLDEILKKYSDIINIIGDYIIIRYDIY